jgi:hypothetical protein
MLHRFRPANVVTCLGVGFIVGCTSLPELGSGSGPDALSPKVSDITDKIQCELISALHAAKYDQDSTFRALAVYKHVVSVNLTLEVTNAESVNPSLSYIKPYATMGTSFSTPVGAQWTGTQDRNYNQTFTLIFGLGDETPEVMQACEHVKANGSLRGELGIKDIIASGLRFEAADSAAFKLKVLGLSKNDPPDALTGSASLAPSFGSTVDFQVVYGVSGGPLWTLTHFTGPGATLGAYTRTLKDTLQLSFARVAPTNSGEDADRDAEGTAGRSAKDNLTLQVLQRIISRPGSL